MSTAAVVMMVLAILLIWGGLALAIINLVRHPEHAQHEFHRDL